MKRITKSKNPLFIHSSVELSYPIHIGNGCSVWNNTQIRENCSIGNDCIIGKGVYIDKGVKIGNKCKIQNYSCLYHGSVIKNSVFIGPGVLILNDKYPRSVNSSGELKGKTDWKEQGVYVDKGASIGAGSILLPGIKIGKYSLIGAGSVVTKSIPSFSLVIGNPAKITGKVNKEGKILKKI
jgi:UDP-2-acetamido-3-amino-2,3-dideoxy-glucuronate N-acetyltransferase